MEFPTTVHDADAWLLSGSRHGAYDDVPFIPPLEQLIRDIHNARVPMVGICFGHQIVAQALGGKVIKSPRGWNCGRNLYRFGSAEKILNAWHQDEVVAAPPEAEVVGSSPRCEISMIRYKGKTFTVQPHPEFDDEALKIVMDGPSSKLLTAKELKSVRDGLGTPHDNAWMAGEITQFLKEAGDSR
ncbi:MAG: type 1 glutamine amidotransferase [Silicimonas sp.]|nr:type 1 glutamine amidotransferase [Silicimonas sp.]